MILQDLRYGLRMLARHPAVTLVEILTLTLTVGMSAAIFSVVNALLVRSLPYVHPERLVRALERDRHEMWPFSPADLLAVREQTGSLEEMAGYQFQGFNARIGPEPERLQGAVASVNLFSMLGVPAQLGRLFGPENGRPGGDAVVVLDHDFWANRFHADSSVLGKTIALDGKPFAVIGVLPAGFHMVRGGGIGSGFASASSTDFWLPLPLRSNDNRSFLETIGRLRPGVGIDQARSEANIVAARLERQSGQPPTGWQIVLQPLQDELVAPVRAPLLILQAAVLAVLLIACVNLGNLRLARALGRAGELAVRVALGAGRLQIARQLVIESLLLALAGGASGVLLAWWALRAFVAVAPGALPRLEEVGIDRTTLAFTLLTSVAAGLFFGLIPALRATRTDIREGLGRRGAAKAGRSAQHLRKALVTAQVGLAMTVLLCSALLIQSFLRLRAVNPGFRPENLVTMQFTLALSKYGDGLKMASFYRQLLERVRNLPGVEAACTITVLPVGGIDRVSPTLLLKSAQNREPREIPPATTPLMSPGCLQTLNIPLLRGRGLEERDNEDATAVVVINQVFAQRYFGNEDPIGRRLAAKGAPLELTIVGVAGDVRMNALAVEPGPTLFMPYVQVPRRIMSAVMNPMTLAIRSSGNPLSLAGSVRSEVRALDPEQPVSNVRTMDEVLSDSVALQRFQTILMAIFGAIALILAISGVYSMLAYLVSLRTPEIGVRVTLGARPYHILGIVLRETLWMALGGAVLGVLAAFALSRTLASLLYGVHATDTVTLTSVVVLLMAAALAGSWVPALRALSVDPVQAIRRE